MIKQVINLIATWFCKQIDKKNPYLTLFLIPIIMLIGIFVYLYEESYD